MAEYIEREALMGVLDDAKYAVPSNDFQRGVNASVEVLTKEVKYFPTADVVPKSEYDRLEKLFNDMTQEAKGYLNRIYGIRAEVARQIFKSIESKLMVAPNIEDFDGYVRMLLDDFCELKEKYTEENV